MTIDDQPISAVRWVPRDRLKANDYNPNRVFAPELDLLARSILEDGWTTAIVVRSEPDPADDRFEIVDGFHRFTVSGRPNVAALTGGLVPVVRLRASLSPADQRISTIRHNRARGHHNVLQMANITADLTGDLGVPDQEVMDRLGMEPDELERLKERGNMTVRGAGAEFGKSWVPQ